MKAGIMKQAVKKSDVAGERYKINCTIVAARGADLRRCKINSTIPGAWKLIEQIGAADRDNKYSSTTGRLKQPVKPTKKSRLVNQLSRKRGGGVGVLMKRLGWLAQMTRAAIARLRSEGQEVVQTTSSDGKKIYQIFMPSDCRSADK